MKKKRTPRRVINPLYLIGGMQKIGKKHTRELMSEYDSFLWHVDHGKGYAKSVRGITLFLAALHDAATHYNARFLLSLIDQTGELWVRAGERCTGKGITDRIVVNAEERAALEQLHAAMDAFLPEVEAGPWVSFVDNAKQRWDTYARTSAFTAGLEE